MTDSKLRELERRWKETGSVEHEAAYLLERVRAGDLAKEKLELAAYCGHEGARGALGKDAPNVPAEIGDWLIGLSRFGARPFVLLDLHLLSERGAPEALKPLIKPTSDWAECPCLAHSALVSDALTEHEIVARDPWAYALARGAAYLAGASFCPDMLRGRDITSAIQGAAMDLLQYLAANGDPQRHATLRGVCAEHALGTTRAVSGAFRAKAVDQAGD